MAFKYRKRDTSELEKRAENKGDFIGYLRPEYSVYAVRDGDNWIRILPPTDPDQEHWGIDLHTHFGIGPENAAVLCNLKMAGEKCVICDAASKADRAGDEELAKSLRPTRRLLVWVLDMNEEKKGPQLWAMPKSVDADIVKITKDRTSGEWLLIDHPDDGYDLNFHKAGKQRNTRYSGFVIARRPSSVADRWLDYIEDNPLLGTLIDRTPEEVQAIYEGGTERKRPRDDDEEPAPRRRAAARDEDEDERPAKPARRAARDEDDEPPARTRRAADEDERPARRASRDEEEKPARTSRRAAAEDDEPPRRKRAAEPEEEEEPAPRRRGKILEDDEIPFDEPAKDAPRKRNRLEPESEGKGESEQEKRRRELAERYAAKKR